MARAKRHYISGQVWHITHRCHQREFLLKFAKDKRRWIQWLFESKRRYGLTILNYVVISNHIHLLVVDGGERETIPKSIQLTAGRCAQEYNLRKKRKGAYWEDRYHAAGISLEKESLKREGQWSESLAVGGKKFVKGIKAKLGGRASGRQVRETSEEFEIREESCPYDFNLGAKNEDIGLKNVYFWNKLYMISRCYDGPTPTL